MRDVVIVALDYGDAESALECARTIRGRVKWVKVGMTLYYAAGSTIVRDLRSLGFKVFVDLKLHDIPHQVKGACRTLTRVGADMFTVHAAGGRAMLEAAVEATDASAKKFNIAKPLILAVTVLTSLDETGLHEVGVTSPVLAQVKALATLSTTAGCDGVVCSPQEVVDVRAAVGEDALIVTPGVRPSGECVEDQARVATPAEALTAGATYLVIGRSITNATDPVAALDNILKEIADHEVE